MYYHIFNEDWWDTLNEEWKEVFLISIRNSDCRDKFEAITKLHTIIAPNKRLTTLKPLKELKNIRHLYLAYNYITDLSPLSNLENLKTLNITSNEVTDLSPLKGCINLTELKCQFNNIRSIEPVVDLPYLSNLIYDDKGNSLRNKLKKNNKMSEIRSFAF